MPLQSSSSCGQVSRFFVWERRMLYFRVALLKGMIPEISISRKIWVHILQSEQHMKLFCGKIIRKTQTCTALQPIRITSHKIEANILFFKDNSSTPTCCNLKCFQAYRFHLKYLLKKGSLFSSVFLSSPEIQKANETLKVTSWLYMLGTVRFSKHLLCSSSILLIFLNLSSFFHIIWLYNVSISKQGKLCLFSCLRFTGDHLKVLDVAHALCSVLGWVNYVNISTASPVHR